MKTVILGLLIFAYGSSTLAGQTKTCSPKRHAKVPAVYGLTYRRARTKLIAAGWQPLQTIITNAAPTDPNIAYGNGQIFWNRGYVEVEGCSGTGIGACAFLFRDVYGNRLRVNTAGEEIPKEKAYATVNGYQFVCGAANK